MSDQSFLRDAIALGRLSRRVSPPNPWVGALVVNDGVVVGRGHTEAPGGAHAEVLALADAGPLARGATLYVTLEPCAHVGRTGPCTDAVVAAGIARVVYGVGDPDPRVAGAGVAALTKAGVSVEGPLLVEEISRELSAYLHHRRTGRPEVVLKIAATLDGQIAAVDGSSRWITSGESRRAVHEMRADADVIVVGAGTVRVDNPDLRARDAVSPRDPRRVVLGTVPADARCQPAEAYDGDLSTLLDRLGTDGVLQVVVEGGPRVWESFLRAGLVQKITWFQAPALAGGASNHHVLPGLATTTIDELRRYRLVEVTRIGEDIRLDLEV